MGFCERNTTKLIGFGVDGGMAEKFENFGKFAEKRDLCAGENDLQGNRGSLLLTPKGFWDLAGS